MNLCATKLSHQQSNGTGQPEQTHQIIVTPSHNRSRTWDERPGQPGIHIVLYCIVSIRPNILRCINGMDKHKKLSKHFENILFVIGCVVIQIVKLIVCSNYISLSN